MAATRPMGMEGFLRASDGFATEDGFRKGLAFQPRPTDVFISPYSKCGTTWMQQIVHGLRSGGSMAFGEITEVVPWIELAHDLGIDPETDQPGHPRAFKSHLRWDEIPKGGKYIVVFRDPLDAFLSLFRFMQGWFFEPGSVSVEAFARYCLDRPDAESYWGHAASWWGQRDNPDVLLLSYDMMKRDLAGVVAQVAGFIGVDADEDLLALATRQAGFEFMKAHASQFDDNLVRRMRDAACGLPEGGSSNKVDKGQMGHRADLINADLRAEFARKWNQTLGQEFELADYRAMAERLG